MAEKPSGSYAKTGDLAKADTKPSSPELLRRRPRSDVGPEVRKTVIYGNDDPRPRLGEYGGLYAAFPFPSC